MKKKSCCARPANTNRNIILIRASATSVLFTEDIGGIILFVFDEEGNLQIRTEAKESDYNYDEIGAALEVKEIQRQRRDMLHGLELYYRAVFLHQDLDLESWQLE